MACVRRRPGSFVDAFGGDEVFHEFSLEDWRSWFDGQGLDFPDDPPLTRSAKRFRQWVLEERRAGQTRVT